MSQGGSAWGRHGEYTRERRNKKGEDPLHAIIGQLFTISSGITGGELWLPSPAIFWLGGPGLVQAPGASLDRDFASPGLLGVRWDGPAGGTTFRDPVAEPRPGFRSRAYVSGPSAGGGAKVAIMMQVSTQYETSPGGGAAVAPPCGRKNGEGTFLEG